MGIGYYSVSLYYSTVVTGDWLIHFKLLIVRQFELVSGIDRSEERPSGENAFTQFLNFLED